MSELADINARIDRLNAKLKARPIEIVAPWPWAKRRPGCKELTYFLWAVCFDLGTLHAAQISISLGSLEDVRRICNECLGYLCHGEEKPTETVLFARKIQLAILERLT